VAVAIAAVAAAVAAVAGKLHSSCAGSERARAGVFSNDPSTRSRDFVKTQASSPTETTLERPFKVDSISRAAAPTGQAGPWHSYVISQGTNTIAGIRAGTHSEVTMLLEVMVDRLNDRRAGRTKPRSKA
jgi:hypothetical protein